MRTSTIIENSGDRHGRRCQGRTEDSPTPPVPPSGLFIHAEGDDADARAAQDFLTRFGLTMLCAVAAARAVLEALGLLS